MKMRLRAKYRPYKNVKVNVTTKEPEEPKKEPKKNIGPDYRIREIKIRHAKLPQPQAAQQNVIPKHPFRWYLVGASGSGKTNLLVSLLVRPEFYAGYFDSVLVMTGTPVHLDPAYKKLGLPEKNFYPVNVDVLSRVMDLQEDHIDEVGLEHARKVLIILDDIIAYPEFARSPELIDLFIKSRKWNISVILLSQAYHRVHKTVRLQSTALTFFKGSNKEMEVLTEDFNAPGTSTREFMSWINYATHDPYQFFFVDLHQPITSGRRYRKNLDEPIVPGDPRLVEYEPRRHHKSKTLKTHGLLRKTQAVEARPEADHGGSANRGFEGARGDGQQ